MRDRQTTKKTKKSSRSSNGERTFTTSAVVDDRLIGDNTYDWGELDTATPPATNSPATRVGHAATSSSSPGSAKKHSPSTSSTTKKRSKCTTKDGG